MFGFISNTIDAESDWIKATNKNRDITIPCSIYRNVAKKGKKKRISFLFSVLEDNIK